MRVAKAGAFVLAGKRFVFMFGPPPSGDRLGVVRLGGHREGDESPWECACREVLEEASVQIVPLDVPATYWADPVTRTLSEGAWPAGEIRPLVVVRHRNGTAEELTVLYLASTAGSPVPAAETKGLLMPTAAELKRLISRPETLSDYLASGGLAIRRVPMDERLPLAPSYHLEYLNQLLQRQII